MKILVAIDDSVFSNEVLQSVTSRNWQNSTPLEFLIVTVLEPICVGSESDDNVDQVRSLVKVDAQRRRRAQRLCQRSAERIKSHIPDADVQWEMRLGTAAPEIVAAAEAWSADKIVIGVHSRDICPHYSLGSVSRAVAENSPCSVEVVKRKPDARQKSVPLASARAK